MHLGFGFYRHQLRAEDFRFARQCGATHAVVHRQGFNGVLIPDHAPQMTCDAPWHAGMAHAMGYMRSALDQWGG